MVKQPRYLQRKKVKSNTSNIDSPLTKDSLIVIGNAYIHKEWRYILLVVRLSRCPDIEKISSYLNLIGYSR
jgi:hypothetical protein